MGHNEHYIYLERLEGMEEIDRALEKIAKEGRFLERIEKVREKRPRLAGFLDDVYSLWKYR